MILVGDIGGTKTLLEIGTLCEGGWRPIFAGRYTAGEHRNFEAVLDDFLLRWSARGNPGESVTRACFGVAGPAIDDRVQMTNLPWLVDAAALRERFGFSSVRLVNDFHAAASGVGALRPDDCVVLQEGAPAPAAPRLVIGAGTGLGIACLVWSGARHEVIAGEGGHVGFSPATKEQMDLWLELSANGGRVTAEDVVSGPGLSRISDFIGRRAGHAPTTADNSPPAIVRRALALGDPLALRALDLFIACYGEIAGNFALAVLARGGVYIAGGIASRIISRLETGGFIAAFNAKGAHTPVAKKIPVYVVTEDRLGLLGCAQIATRDAWQADHLGTIAL